MKSKIQFISIFISVFFSSSNQVTILKRPKGATIRLAFGSCAKFYWDDNAPIFSTIAKERPDAFLWLGDAAYLDDQKIFYFYSTFPTVEKAKRRLEATKTDPDYAKLKNSTKIIGVWDNHDYGDDSGDINFPFKEQMQQVFLDFIDEPKESSRRTRKGIYESYEMYSGDFKVKLILLDVRYFRNETSGDMLGDAQWTWLQEQLNEKSDLVLIASGTQILPEDRLFHSQWFSKSRERLLGMLRDTDSPLFLLSGDVHLAEFLTDDEVSLSSCDFSFRVWKRDY